MGLDRGRWVSVTGDRTENIIDWGFEIQMNGELVSLSLCVKERKWEYKREDVERVRFEFESMEAGLMAMWCLVFFFFLIM